MTEEVQVTSLSTYPPVILWGGTNKQLGGCKQKLLNCWFTERVTVDWHKEFINMIQTFCQHKILSRTVSIRNMVVESRQNLYLRDMGFSPTCGFILWPSGF